MASTTHRSFYVWFALSLLLLLSWLGAESKLPVATLASLKFLGIFWYFMEMRGAHRGWLALALTGVGIWFGASQLL